jgi:hypothetical protein
MADQTIDQLLKQLSLQPTKASSSRTDKKDGTTATTVPPGSTYQAELNLTQFTIFTPLSDCGYYKWSPNNNARSTATSNLSNIQSSVEIINQIDLETKPPKLVPSSQLRLPQRFYMSLPAQEFSNQYPYGQYEIASLRVATNHRNVNLNEIDFIFGGSTLEMLARHDMSNPYMVTRVPTTSNTILVVKCKEYIQNLSDFGFQFERFVTGGNMKNVSNKIEFVEHMHTMQIGSTYKVLFCAELDGIDAEGDPVEITSKNPKYWGTNVMFQMISVGCPSLCCGTKGRDILTEVRIRRLSDVASEALRRDNRSRLEQNIIDGMKALQEQMVDKDDGEVYKVSFDRNGKLQLLRANTRNAVLLPPINVVKELL